MEEFSFEMLIIRWYRFIRQNIITIILFPVLFIVLAVVYNSSKPKAYVSNALIYSNIAHEERISQIITDLTVLTEKGNHTSLAKFLNLTQEEASQIKSIEVEISDLKISSGRKDGIFNDFDKNCLSVNIKVSDPSVITNVELGLKSYLVNNRFLNKLHASRKESLKSIIKKIDEQIKSLEEYQKSSIAHMDEDSDALVINSELNSASVDMIYLLEKKENYLEMISHDEVEYIKPFVVPEKPESKLILYIAAGMIVGIILGIFFALIRKLNSKL